TGLLAYEGGGLPARDGKQLLFSAAAPGSQPLSTFDFANKKKRVLLPPGSHLSFPYAPRFSPDGSRIVFSASGDNGQIPMIGGAHSDASPSGRGGGLHLLGVGHFVGEWLFGTPAEADGPPWD